MTTFAASQANNKLGANTPSKSYALGCGVLAPNRLRFA